MSTLHSHFLKIKTLLNYVVIIMIIRDDTIKFLIYDTKAKKFTNPNVEFSISNSSWISTEESKKAYSTLTDYYHQYYKTYITTFESYIIFVLPTSRKITEDCYKLNDNKGTNLDIYDDGGILLLNDSSDAPCLVNSYYFGEAYGFSSSLILHCNSKIYATKDLDLIVPTLSGTYLVKPKILDYNEILDSISLNVFAQISNGVYINVLDDLIIIDDKGHTRRAKFELIKKVLFKKYNLYKPNTIYLTEYEE